MVKCDKVNLLKIQGQYLGFIVENHTELNILEHIEQCKKCQNKIIDAIDTDKPLQDYGNLFQRKFENDIVPQFDKYENPMTFIKARVQWRKRKIKKLIKNAEIELEDLETRL